MGTSKVQASKCRRTLEGLIARRGTQCDSPEAGPLRPYPTESLLAYLGQRVLVRQGPCQSSQPHMWQGVYCWNPPYRHSYDSCTPHTLAKPLASYVQAGYLDTSPPPHMPGPSNYPQLRPGTAPTSFIMDLEGLHDIDMASKHNESQGQVPWTCKQLPQEVYQCHSPIHISHMGVSKNQERQIEPKCTTRGIPKASTLEPEIFGNSPLAKVSSRQSRLDLDVKNPQGPSLGCCQGTSIKLL